MNPHMPRQEGAGDMRRSMDPFNPNPLHRSSTIGQDGIRELDRAALRRRTGNGVHVVPGSDSMKESRTSRSRRLTKHKPSKLTNAKSNNQQMTEDLYGNWKDWGQGLQDKPFNLEEKSKERHQQLDMENWVDHMTKPKLFNYYDESDGNASRSL